MNVDPDFFWKQIDQLRQDKKLQWADIAKACDLFRPTLSTMKGRGIFPDYPTGCIMRNLLDTSDSFLLKGNFGTPKNPDFPERVVEGVQKILSHRFGLKILEGLASIPNEQFFSILAIVMAFHVEPESLVP